jgi:predicted small metal-binding protein
MDKLMRGTCEDGFMIESHDEKEAAGVLQQHVKDKHKMDITESEAMAKLVEVPAHEHHVADKMDVRDKVSKAVEAP